MMAPSVAFSAPTVKAGNAMAGALCATYASLPPPQCSDRMPTKQEFGERLSARMTELGVSLAQVGKAVGRDKSTVRRWILGEHFPDPELWVPLATRLQTTSLWLVLGQTEGAGGVPMAGSIGPGGVVVTDIGGVDTAPRLPGHSGEDLVAYRVEDIANTPVYRPGDIVYIDMHHSYPTLELLGEDCIVCLQDGSRVLRRLMPSGDEGVFALEAYGGQAMARVSVSSAWPVVGVLRGNRRR